MKNRTPLRVAVATLLLGSLLSCHKALDVAPTSVAPSKSAPQDDMAFDWENATYPPSQPGSEVRLPWISGGSSTVDISIASDYHRIDGWDMVYNTFTPSTNPNNSSQPPIYFALYNRFRGILRYYILNPGSAVFSSQLEHGLELMPNYSTSSILNFNGNEVIDPSNNVKGFTTTSVVQLNSTSTWYVMQYQIAYDSNYPSQSYSSFHPNWNARYVNITSTKSNGTEIGSINGSITTPAPGIDWVSFGVNGVLATADIFGTAKSLPKKFSDAAAGGLAGNFTGLLNALIGGNSANSQEVALTLNSTITTTGTQVNKAGILNIPFLLPGQQVDPNQAPAAPIVSYTLGLFNVVQRPIVNIRTLRQASFQNNGETWYHYYNNFTVNTTDFTTNALKINQAVQNSTATGAKVEVTNTEVVLLSSNGLRKSTTGKTETLVGSGQTVLTGSGFNLYIDSDDQTAADEQANSNFNVAVRVTLKVTPNNTSSPPSTIVKTFLANPNYM